MAAPPVQVLSVCKLVSSAGAKFRSAAATGGHKLRSQAEALQDGLAVLVGTPGRIRALVNQGVLEVRYPSPSPSWLRQ